MTTTEPLIDESEPSTDPSDTTVRVLMSGLMVSGAGLHIVNDGTYWGRVVADALNVGCTCPACVVSE